MVGKRVHRWEEKSGIRRYGTEAQNKILSQNTYGQQSVPVEKFLTVFEGPRVLGNLVGRPSNAIRLGRYCASNAANTPYSLVGCYCAPLLQRILKH